MNKNNTVATATTARANNVVRNTSMPNCSRMPMRILTLGVLEVDTVLYLQPERHS